MIQTIYLPISVYSTEYAARDLLEQHRDQAAQELDDALNAGYSVLSTTSVVQDGRTYLVYVLHHPTDQPVEQLNDDDLADLDAEQIERILERVLHANDEAINLLTDAGLSFDVAKVYRFVEPQEIRDLLRSLNDAYGEGYNPCVLEKSLLKEYPYLRLQRPVAQNGGAL